MDYLDALVEGASSNRGSGRSSAAKGSSHALRFIAHISLVWMVLQRACVGRLACSAEMVMESAFGGLAIAAICGM